MFLIFLLTYSQYSRPRRQLMQALGRPARNISFLHADLRGVEHLLRYTVATSRFQLHTNAAHCRIADEHITLTCFAHTNGTRRRGALGNQPVKAKVEEAYRLQSLLDLPLHFTSALCNFRPRSLTPVRVRLSHRSTRSSSQKKIGVHSQTESIIQNAAESNVCVCTAASVNSRTKGGLLPASWSIQKTGEAAGTQGPPCLHS